MVKACAQHACCKNPGMTARPRDSVDDHVGRWAAVWADNPAFDPEVEGAITRMQNVLRTLRRTHTAAFAGKEFSLEDYNTLHALMVQAYPNEATPAQLADTLGLTRAAVTSRLDRLVEAGLVTRETDPLDRRRVIVRPTRAGRRAWETSVDEGMLRERQLLAALTGRELVQLNTLLRKVVRSWETD